MESITVRRIVMESITVRRIVMESITFHNSPHRLPGYLYDTIVERVVSPRWYMTGIERVKRRIGE